MEPEPRGSGHRRPEADAEGRPQVVVREEDREAVADALADLLLADLDERKDGAA